MQGWMDRHMNGLIIKMFTSLIWSCNRVYFNDTSKVRKPFKLVINMAINGSQLDDDMIFDCLLQQ